MISTPIYTQLVRECGELRSPLARAYGCVTATVAVADALATGDRSYFYPEALFGPLPAPLVLEEPIYDGLVNEMGYPHCSPVEALVSYTSGDPWPFWRRRWMR